MIFRTESDHADIIKEGGTFCIVNLADIQLCTRDWVFRTKRYKVLKRIVEEAKKENFDLVTLSGDQGYGHFFATLLLSNFLDKLAPWAPVFGNHDYEEVTTSLARMQKIFCRKKSCLMRKNHPSLGYGNYFIRLLNEKNELVRVLVFMDSGKEKVTKEQVEWYEKTILSFGSEVPSTLITHTPLPIFREAYNEAVLLGKVPETQRTGSKTVRKEIVSAMSTDSGLFDAVKRFGSTDMILVGHDHKNNYVLEKEGVTLVASQKTGIGGYYDPAVNGVTVLRFSDRKKNVKQLFC